MNEEGANKTPEKICPTCGKRLAGGSRAGSLTAFLFAASDCACLRGGGAAPASPSYSRAEGEDEIEFCPKCGLQIVANSRDGSLTGFLFGSTRCKCPLDQVFAEGVMSAKFWKLKQAGGGTTFASAVEQIARADTNSIDLAEGAIIGGAYEIIELLGRGGMGEVYLARHETLGKKCALKVIPPEQVTEIGWQRFQQEAKAVAKLEHVNLVRVTDLGIHEGCLPFYAMDYVEGTNLAEVLAKEGPMPLMTMLEIFMQVCDGVECAHRSGILHRDLKPANIMVVTNKAGTRQAKVLDFGLAKLTKHDRSKQSLTAIGDIFGSPFYMSPEQCNGEKLDNRSDIYSLGCSMFECLTGGPPFTGHLAAAVIFSHLEADPPSLESIVGPGRFPESMEVVIAKLLRKNPVERYQTLSQLKSDLQKVAAGKEVLPVYRSREAKGDQPGPTSIQARDRPLQDLPGVSLRHAVMGFGLIGLLLFCAAAIGIYVLIQRPVKTMAHVKTPGALGNLPDVESTDSTIRLSDEQSGLSKKDKAEAAKRLVGLKEITSSTNMADGTRVFTCPDFHIGTFAWPMGPKDRLGADIQTDGGRMDGYAKSRVPAGVPIYLIVSPSTNRDTWLCPDILSRFGPKELTGLYTHAFARASDIASKEELEGIANQVAGLVKATSGWTNLQFFGSSDLPIPDQALVELDKHTTLTRFRAFQADLHADVLAKRRFLKRLKIMDLIGLEDIDPVLRALSGSIAIEDIAISRCPLSAIGLKALANCPNLKVLDLSEIPIDQDQLAAISSIRSLKVLLLAGANLKPEQTPALVKLKFIPSLKLVVSDWPSGSVQDLQKMLPQATIH